MLYTIVCVALTSTGRERERERGREREREIERERERERERGERERYIILEWTTGAKTIKKNTNSTPNKYQTHRAKQYEVTSFLITYCELSTETCSKNVYS